MPAYRCDTTASRTPNDDGNHLDFLIYGYVPSFPAGVAFLALFALLTVVHLAITIKSRVWWTTVSTFP